MGQHRRVIAAAAVFAAASLTIMWKGPAGPFSACASSCSSPLYYQSVSLAGGSKAHVVSFKLGASLLKPAVAEPTTAPTSETATRYGAAAATNGGYFNLKGGGQSTSWIVIDGKTIADPHENKLLVENAKLVPYLPKIFNRTELRIFSDQSLQICNHDDSVPKGKTIAHVLGGGPRLLPKLTAEEEAFYRVDPDGTTTDAISVKRPAARTAFGITKDGRGVMISVAGKGQDPESSGVTLAQLADAMKKFGCTEAINFDGGASATMYTHFDMRSPGKVVCGKRPETRVKSILMLLPTLKQK